MAAEVVDRYRTPRGLIEWPGQVLDGHCVGYSLYLIMTQGEAAAQNPNLMVLYSVCFLAGGAGVGLLFTLVSFFPSHDLPSTWTITAETN